MGTGLTVPCQSRVPFLQWGHIRPSMGWYAFCEVVWARFLLAGIFMERRWEGHGPLNHFQDVFPGRAP